jgi:hypothetical protein
VQAPKLALFRAFKQFHFVPHAGIMFVATSQWKWWMEEMEGCELGLGGRLIYLLSEIGLIALES